LFKRLTLALAFLSLVLWQPTHARPLQEPDGVAALLARLEEVLRGGTPSGYLPLLSDTADRARATAFAGANVTAGSTRVVIRERDRQPLVGALPGDGYQLNVEVLVESGQRARLATWRLDLRRRGGEAAAWGIANQEVITSVHGLYRLALNSARQFTARNLVIADEDLRLTLAEGSVFVAEVAGDGSATALVLLGRGEMVFAPAPATEKGQLRLLVDAETLQTPFDTAFVRLNPGSLRNVLDPATISEAPVDPRELRRAEEVFRQDVGRSFSLDLGNLSPDTWSLVPGFGDLLVEVRTRRFDTLTYTRSSNEVEDVTLFDRRNRRNISVYSSKANAAQYGRSFAEDDHAEYAVLDYDIEARFNPSRLAVEGRTVMSIEVKADSLSSLTFRLAEPLEVEAVTSIEFGRLLALRVRDQNGIVVNLPSTVTRGFRMMIAIDYAGILPPQPVDREGLVLEPQFGAPVQQVEEFDRLPLEESYLYSNRSYWYPQPGSPNYATARMRLAVPANYGLAATGDLVTVVSPPAPKGTAPARQYHFLAHQPARYFACLVTMLKDVKRERVDIGDLVEPFRALRRPGVYYDDVMLTVRAQPKLQARGRELAKTAADIIRFYSSVAGDAPYPTLTLAVVERPLPGGHSPPYLAVLAQPSPSSRLTYRDDPASFSDFPEFFLAHELAHQWWGQGVGWKNYHEQWISEGFAQYFAALYAEKLRGRAVFGSVMRRMARFGIDQSESGPIWLGYRVGHLRGDSRAFRAIVYNKAAVVLHMLRGLVGDEVFFRGIHRFLDTWRFKKAGTEEFREAMEAEAGRPLGRFFERWIYGDTLPRVTVAWNEAGGDGGRREAVIRVEQIGEELFDFPLQLSVVYADRVAESVTIAVRERTTEARVPLLGTVRNLEANRDGLALAVVK
jgi:hypothetical protein